MKFEDFREKTTVKFSVDDDKYVIAKLKDVPEFSDEVFCIIRDRNEVTVVAKERLRLKSTSEEKHYKLITFNVKLPFELTGFLSRVSTLLAEKGIPILAFSAYSTDHLLVKEENLHDAVEALEKDGMVML